MTKVIESIVESHMHPSHCVEFVLEREAGEGDGEGAKSEGESNVTCHPTPPRHTHTAHTAHNAPNTIGQDTYCHPRRTEWGEGGRMGGGGRRGEDRWRWGKIN